MMASASLWSAMAGHRFGFSIFVGRYDRKLCERIDKSKEREKKAVPGYRTPKLESDRATWVKLTVRRRNQLQTNEPIGSAYVKKPVCQDGRRPGRRLEQRVP